MRCARRQNDAAYQHYRRRSVSGRHAIIIHRRHMDYQRSRGYVPSALDCKAAAESWSDRASFPGKRGRSPWADGLYVQRDVMRMPEPEEFRRLHQHRATPFPPNLAFPTPNLDRRGFSRASSTSSWEMQRLPCFVLKQIGHYSRIRQISKKIRDSVIYVDGD